MGYAGAANKICPHMDTRLAAREAHTAAFPALSHTELIQVLIHEMGDLEQCPS